MLRPNLGLGCLDLLAWIKFFLSSIKNWTKFLQKLQKAIVKQEKHNFKLCTLCCKKNLYFSNKNKLKEQSSEPSSHEKTCWLLHLYELSHGSMLEVEARLQDRHLKRQLFALKQYHHCNKSMSIFKILPFLQTVHSYIYLHVLCMLCQQI